MNGLAQITIDGQPVALKFGLPALRQLSEKMVQYKLFNGDQYNDLGISHILFAGYENACAMEDKASVIPFKSFYLYVEDAEGETITELAKAVSAFIDSKAVKELLDKKKVTKEPTSEP